MHSRYANEKSYAGHIDSAEASVVWAEVFEKHLMEIVTGWVISHTQGADPIFMGKAMVDTDGGLACLYISPSMPTTAYIKFFHFPQNTLGSLPGKFDVGKDRY